MFCRKIDNSIAEAVASILWATPRINHDVGEFKAISAQFERKYGKKYAEMARIDQLKDGNRVSPKLIQKLSIGAPSKFMVEK
jgi:vacuolar protein sorting-associated protein IST1